MLKRLTYFQAAVSTSTLFCFMSSDSENLEMIFSIYFPAFLSFANHTYAGATL